MPRIPWQPVRVKLLLAVLAATVCLLGLTNTLFFRTAIN